MKNTIKSLSVLVLISLLSLTNTQAQNKYAIFIYGFEGSDSSWTGPSIQVPQQWKAEGIITDYVAITYQASQMGNDLGKDTVMNDIGTKMQEKAKNGEWIIVGHSLGGIVARAAYHYLKTTAPYNTLNIKAITTIGTPSQGANPAHLSITGQPGFINVAPQIATFRNLVQDPLTVIHSSVALITSFIDGDALSQLENAPTILDDVFNKLNEYATISENIPAKDVIGRLDAFNPDPKSLIFQINSSQTLKPTHVRSIIGSEKQFTPVRAANEVYEELNTTEVATLSNFKKIRDFYKTNADAWHATNIIYQTPWGGFNFKAAASARKKRDRWKKGLTELNNIDTRWGSIIDAYTYTPYEDVILIPSGTCDGGPGGGPGGVWSIQESVNPDDYTCVNGTLYEIQVIRWYNKIVTKNDGLLTPESCVWDPGSSLTDNPKNHYYDDVPDEGGYNHFELKRYKRNYELKDKDNKIIFSVGDYAPPMRQAAIWIRDEVK